MHAGLCKEPFLSPVENVTVTSYCVADGRIMTDVGWLPPNITFDTEMGALASYNVCMGLEPLMYRTSVSQGVCKQIAVSYIIML